MQELALTNSDALHRVDRLDSLADFFFHGAVQNLSLNLSVGGLGCESDNQLTCLGAHGLLDRGLNTLLRDDQWLQSNEVSVGGHDINDIVDLSTVPADLSADVVGLVVVTDECGQGVLANTFCDTESEDHVHLGEVTIEFLLRHFIHTAHDMLIGLAQSFSNFLKFPWIARCTNRVPALHLPLVSLLTCCCTCLCTYFLCHGINSGCVYCGGYPTCTPATNLPYFKNPLWTGGVNLAQNEALKATKAEFFFNI